MALILNLETATTVCSVALAEDSQLLVLKEVNGDYTHAENLTNFVEQATQVAKAPVLIQVYVLVLVLQKVFVMRLINHLLL